MTTFSIVVETENLANGELSDLEACLASIGRNLAAHRPNEVILVDSGQVAASVLEEIRRRHSWIAIHVSPKPLHYYDAKLMGTRLATGDVVVFADSDLTYEEGWLDALLRPFERDEVEFVSGETRVEIVGPYTFATATSWIFPRRYPAEPASLLGNNSAVRRAALLALPFPSGLPLYRAQIVLHGRAIRASGRRVLNVAARAWHAPPEGVHEWVLRCAVSGWDAVALADYDIGQTGRVVQRRSTGRRLRAWGRATLRKLASSALRTVEALTERPERVALLPLALPVSAAGILLFALGGFTAVAGSGRARRAMLAFEAAAGGGTRCLISGGPSA